jgi:hypothetical protein
VCARVVRTRHLLQGFVGLLPILGVELGLLCLVDRLVDLDGRAKAAEEERAPFTPDEIITCITHVLTVF